jgi:hypothetical protein
MKFYINLNKLLRSGGRAKIRTDTTNSTTTTTTTTTTSAPTTTTTTTTAAPTTTTTAAPTTTTTTTAAPSVTAYLVQSVGAHGGKYCEDGTYNGKPKYRKGTTNYYIFSSNNGEYFYWNIANGLGSTSVIADIPSSSNTPPAGISQYWYEDGQDLQIFDVFYSLSSPVTLSNTLIYYGNTYNGKPKYNSGGGGLLAQYESQRGVWAIIDQEIDPDNPVVLYENSSNSNTLPLTGWVVADGNSPAPTLIGPTC